MATPTLITQKIFLLLVAAATLLDATEQCRADEIPPPAYQLAAQRAGIPSELLFAVALQESGLKQQDRLIPWPWSLNIAGKSRRYANRASACNALQQALLREQATRIDAGLAQINVGYHKHRYSEPCDLLDPYANLAIAAMILRESHSLGEDWLLAVGRYHRPAGGLPALRYQKSVSRHLAQLIRPSKTPHLTTP